MTYKEQELALLNQANQAFEEVMNTASGTLLKDPINAYKHIDHNSNAYRQWEQKQNELNSLIANRIRNGRKWGDELTNA